jgi:hypothetical protein
MEIGILDVEAAFSNADLVMKCFIEWPEVAQEFRFFTEAEKQQYCIELEKAKYGNIDSPLQWMKTFTGYLKEGLQIEQIKTDPYLLYKHERNGGLVKAYMYIIHCVLDQKAC